MEEEKTSHALSISPDEFSFSFEASPNKAKVKAKAIKESDDEMMTEQRRIVLNSEQWKAFQAALDRPAQDIPQLRKLLTEPGILD
ncbi:MAG: DUF1778 domain-containing protein [Holophagales bacterium]|nr:DUF1778 domain-containing protein [Holophagales bacterium]